MTVGIDVSSLVYQRGVSRYTSNLVRALVQHTSIKPVLYGSSLRQRHQLTKLARSLVAGEKVRIVTQQYPPSVLAWVWHLGLNPISKALPPIDVFHSWDWLQPPDKNVPLVSTIHDLAILKFPETAHPRVVAMHQRAWQVLRDRQAHIIAVSQSTKQDIIKYLEIPPERIKVIYEALPVETSQVMDTLTEERTDILIRKLMLNRPYILFVGTREPRKNLERLIKAWKPLAKDYSLIIAGEEGWDNTDQLSLGTAQEHLRFLGKVSDEELAVLYQEAELFAYPSLYEGFGLPILEAFYHGTPVVTSDVSAMPEVAGNAAMLVNPNSIESIREGMEKVLAESKDAQRKRLQQMVLRLQLFSWKRVADQTANLYRTAQQSTH